MRDVYHEELDALGGMLVEMARLDEAAITQATHALLDADLATAERVIGSDDRIDDLHHELDDRAFALLARQQPVASDLRTIVTSLRMGADLERMGDHARHIAKVARRRYPESAVPPEMRATLSEMGELARHLAGRAGEVVAARDVEGAQAMEAEDDRMDDLFRALFTTMLDPSWSQGVEPAIDVTQCGRYYERFADHAVSVAQRVVYLVTGEWSPEYTG